MYHRVVEDLPEGLYDPAMFVTSSSLSMQIQEITKIYDIVPLSNILDANNKTNRGKCAITFDDGWRDNYTYAFPILKAFHVPSTIFVPINKIGPRQKFWFQDLWDLASVADKGNLEKQFIQYFSGAVPSWKPSSIGIEQISVLINQVKEFPAEKSEGLVAGAYEKLGVKASVKDETLCLEEMREMGSHGVSFGVHGLNHRILPRLGSGEKKREVVDSLSALKKLDLQMTNFFCYPNGDWDEETVSYVKDAGYKGAVTTSLGINRETSDPFLLSRVGVHEEITNSPSLFWFRVCQAMVARASVHGS